MNILATKSPVIAAASEFKARANTRATRNFGTKYFWSHGFSKASGAEVADFLKARIAILEKEIASAKPHERDRLEFALADCCAVLAGKCSTIGEKAHYHAKAADNSLHTANEFLAEQAEKAAGCFHLANSSHFGYESEMIRYNAIAAMAWKNIAHDFPPESNEAKQALLKSSERSQFAQTLLWHRAGRYEVQGAMAEGIGNGPAGKNGEPAKISIPSIITDGAKLAAGDAYLQAAGDLVHIVLLRSHQPPFFPLALFESKAANHPLPNAVDATSAACLARAASLELRVSNFEEAFVPEHYARAFALAFRSVAYFEQAIGLIPAVIRVFSLVHGIPIEMADSDKAQADAGKRQAQAEKVAEFLSGMCSELESHSLWEKSAKVARYAATLFAARARAEPDLSIAGALGKMRDENTGRAKSNFKKAGMQKEASELAGMLGQP